MPGSERVAVLRSAATAILLLLAGAMLAWLCLGTSLVNQFIPAGRPSMTQMAVGVVVWGFAIVVPAGFLLIGFARVAATVEAVGALRPTAVTPQLAKALGPDHLAATDLLLPGGRRIHELVLGPFGIVVLGDVPPASITRHVGTRWEVRDDRGRWIPVEAPVERATRDAERVRAGSPPTTATSWSGSTRRSSATTGASSARPSAPSSPPAELAGWLEALPCSAASPPSAASASSS